jgi:hypothetical protein
MAPSAAPDEPFADRAFRLATAAYAASAASWERGIQSALAELLAFLARQPEQTQTCVAIASNEHPAVPMYRDQVIGRFTTLLSPGFAIPLKPPPPVVAEAIGWGILELIRIHVEERRIEDLPNALPDATLIALTPFVGPAGAEQVAADGPVISSESQPGTQ